MSWRRFLVFLLPCCLVLSFMTGCQEGDSTQVMTSTVDTTATEGSTANTTVPDETAPTAPETTEPTTAPTASPALAEQINSIAEKHHVTGLSVVAFKGQDVVFSHYYGYADQKKTKAVNADTKYRIASVSKTVTGMLAMQLVAEGRLDLQKDISEYMGISVRNPAYPDIPITTYMLLTHTSSIIGGDAYTRNTGEPPFDTLDTIMKEPGFFTSSKPGTRYRYSNVGLGMVTGVIEGVVGERFYDYATRKLQEMDIDAGYLRTKIQTPDTIAQIVYKNTLRVDTPNRARVEQAYEHMPLGQQYLLGHGDLIISGPDLAKIAMALAGDGTYHGKTILPAQQVQDMNTKRVNVGTDGYGLTVGIFTDLLEGRDLYGHSGHADGMVSGLYYDPIDHTGMVFITNGCDATQLNGKYSITRALIELIYGQVIQ